MRYNELGRTNLKVSELCLGTMTFGQQNTEEDGFKQLARAVDAGINFIDTAEMYPIPPSKESCGKTEAFIGNWLQKTGRRDNLIVATKVIGEGDWLPHIRDGKSHPDRHNIVEAVEDSLRRLKSDTSIFTRFTGPTGRPTFSASWAISQRHKTWQCPLRPPCGHWRN